MSVIGREQHLRDAAIGKTERVGIACEYFTVYHDCLGCVGWRDGDSEVIPTITGIEESIDAVLVSAGECHKHPPRNGVGNAGDQG